MSVAQEPGVSAQAPHVYPSPGVASRRCHEAAEGGVVRTAPQPAGTVDIAVDIDADVDRAAVQGYCSPRSAIVGSTHLHLHLNLQDQLNYSRGRTVAKQEYGPKAMPKPQPKLFDPYYSSMGRPSSAPIAHAIHMKVLSHSVSKHVRKR